MQAEIWLRFKSTCPIRRIPVSILSVFAAQGFVMPCTYRESDLPLLQVIKIVLSASESKPLTALYKTIKLPSISLLEPLEWLKTQFILDLTSP